MKTAIKRTHPVQCPYCPETRPSYLVSDHMAICKRRNTQTWSEWKAAIWTSMERDFGYPGLAPLEQYMHRSKKEKRCVECGEPGTERHTSHIVASVPFFWMCPECHTYWETKA